MKETNQFIITVVCVIITSLCIAAGEIAWLEIPRIVFGTVTLLFVP
jgi:type IV secretory pathway VirB2 component (pilin)